MEEDNRYHQLTKLNFETLEPSTAYMLLCVGLAASNQPKGIPVIVNHYLNQLDTLEKKIEWIEYARNGIMKSIVLCGAPRGINAQVELYAHLPEEYKAKLRKTPTSEENQTKRRSQGQDFFHQVYGDNSEIKEAIMKDANGDLWHYIDQIYGNPISNMTYLSPIETELEVIVTLIQMDTMTQLNDHRQGALNVGATEKQVQEAEFIANQVKNLSG